MNWKLEIENWKLARRGFTIVELLVAMALLVILLGLSGMVFHTTVQAHRAAGATIDVTRNLRAITDQLNADFRGLRKDAPLTIWFERQNYDYNGDGTLDELRFDQIQFFADGDFQSTKQYDTDGDIIPDTTVYGNIARVYYGHAWLKDQSKPVPGILKKGYRELSMADGDLVDRESSNILARRMTILTQDTDFPPHPGIDQTTNTLTSFLPILNNFDEYDVITLTLWKQLLAIAGNCDLYLDTCFSNAYDLTDVGAFVQSVRRPMIDMNDYNFLHPLLAQGVIQMQIQWAYTADDLTTDATGYVPLVPANYFAGLRWWPSVDPDGQGNYTSDFDVMKPGNVPKQFGAYLTMPGGTSNTDWNRVKPTAGETPAQMALQRCRTQIGLFRQDFYPKAMKFTFVLTDSNGIFADGKTFTHIVYLDN